jgi:hypothetical protein
MSAKNTLIYTVATSQSMAASFITPPTVIKNLDAVSYQIIITTSNSTGTFDVQGSNDYVPAQPNEVPNAGTWASIPLGGNPASTGSNDNILIDMKTLPFVATRIVYTSTVAGTGTCKIVLVAKRYGG